MKDKNQGYIKIYRRIWDNAISKKPKYLAIFLFLVSHANHKNKDIIVDNKKITMKRGSFLGSITDISKHFKMARSSVSYILDYLISDRMIDIKTSNKNTIFTILNYDEYQKADTFSDNKPTSNRQQADTTNNEKNDNNKNKDKEIYKEKNEEILRLKNEVEKLKKQKTIDIRKKEVYSEKEKYGEFKNVRLTKIEYDKLIQIYHGDFDLSKAIEILGSYVESKGKKYKSHYAVLGKTNWVYKRVYENEGKKIKKSTTSSNDEVFKRFINKQQKEKQC